MKGCYENPEATAEAMRGGWFHPVDLVHRDEDGYLLVVDRKKDLVIRGGYNVYPREVRLVAELPKGPTGKILEKELRARRRTELRAEP
ncbi:AMP-binding protein [Blastococcus capsensis]|uniref:AMP-binding protein n=1 Tax=Blastococcus capsensis TaxID=1564163 RepID=UPI0025409F81|nr:AMP-binding protein [Blastococcus capsensis]MDK3257672.1 AMP-binding protein [Blastococcus capsensis]